MGDLLVRGLADAVKANLTEKAKQGGRSLSDEVKLRLVQSLVDDEQNPRRYENTFNAIRRAFIEADALMSDEEHAEFMHAIEEGRRDLGRPLPEFE
jgi:plasmid stability protein